MKPLKYQILGLNGRDGLVGNDLNSDLNIFTGRNGAGKTSVLKLLWFIISGNILVALNEVTFRQVTIQTDQYEITVFKLTRRTCKIEMKVNGEELVFEDERDEDDELMQSAEDFANPILIERGSSVFFPTFRRIEGGFTLENSRGAAPSRPVRARGDIEEGLISLSRKLTNEPHVFVSAISTIDVASLLLRRYTDCSEQYSLFQQATSQKVIDTIKAFEFDEADGQRVTVSRDAGSVLDSVRSMIEGMEARREEIMAPIDAVRALVQHIFKHGGINFGPRLSFGDAASAVNSSLLSAGEKQMLSFICYNAFYQNSVFFIDEPELSLHVDWQRSLFGILQRQQSSNQFIIATHSPFIYSKYPEKEVQLERDRGDLEISV